jgi:thymidylate kinase
VSIYLDVPVEISWDILQKKNPDAVESDREYIEHSHECAQWLVEEEGKKTWVTIKCAPDGILRSREEIHDEIVQALIARGDIKIQ